MHISRFVSRRRVGVDGVIQNFIDVQIVCIVCCIDGVCDPLVEVFNGVRVRGRRRLWCFFDCCGGFSGGFGGRSIFGIIVPCRRILTRFGIVWRGRLGLGLLFFGLCFIDRRIDLIGKRRIWIGEDIDLSGRRLRSDNWFLCSGSRLFRIR